MASSIYYPIVNFLLFCILLQKIILIRAQNNCVNPTFAKDQKIEVDYFFNAEVIGLTEDFCPIQLNSNGLISIVYHMCSDLKDKCNEDLPSLYPVIADCVCAGSADDILAKNEAARIEYGIQILPALILNQKFDPCFTDYSLAGIKAYFCKAYNNELPICK